jgi:zinc-finger binding domain of transposase IS66
VLAIDGDICGCCGGAFHAIGESIREMLDWVPAQLRVMRITRPKYACRSCNKVAQTAAPERLIAGGWPHQPRSHRCWSVNIAITRRFIGSRKSLPGTASISAVRRWPDGLAAPAGGWKRCTSDCAKTYSPPTISSPTTPRSRCSIRAAEMGYYSITTSAGKSAPAVPYLIFGPFFRALAGRLHGQAHSGRAPAIQVVRTSKFVVKATMSARAPALSVPRLCSIPKNRAGTSDAARSASSREIPTSVTAFLTADAKSR